MKEYLPALKASSLFLGLSEEEILTVLTCLNAKEKKYRKGELLLRVGDCVESLGLMLSGEAIVVQEDIWGRRTVMDKLSPSDAFAEPFASSGGPINVSVQANCDTVALYLNLNRLLTSCSSACSHHRVIIQNLVITQAKRILKLNSKITHMSKRTTRDKLLSFLSSQAQSKGSLSFSISFDRQELADYLSVERSAMSTELSKLQKEGVISFNKNHFTLHSECDV